MGRAPVSKDKKIEVTALLKDDQSQRTVAKKVGVSQCCVGNVAKKLKVDAPLTNAPGQGRKRLSTEREDRRLLQICKADRTKCNRQLSSEFTLSNGTQLSARTIRRRLLDGGYRSYTAKRKPIRNASQRKLRLQFANDHITWLPYDWKRIIWTDEAHFELFNRKNRTLVRRTRSKSEKPFSFAPRMQKGGGSISLWGCMTSEGIGDVVFYDGRVNRQTYIHVIGDTLIRFIKRRFNANDNFMLMQDNAPPHTCHYAMKFFKANDILVMFWPSTLPDLNPIENIWDIIDDRLKTMRPRNLKELQSMIQQIWDNITEETCKKLVDSMPRRLKSCQRVKGGTMYKY